MPTLFRPLVVVSLLLGCASAEPPLRLQPLWIVPVSNSQVQSGSLDRPVRVRIVTDGARDLSARFSDIRQVDDGAIVAELGGPRVWNDERGAVAAPTFLVDHENPEIGTAIDALTERFGSAPTDDDIIHFVRGWIEPSMARSFDTASQVAQHREGDCTEHAVFVTALARALDIPARIVLGTAFVESQGQVGAYGHAWSEIYRDDAWTLIDATPFGDEGNISYLPDGIILDEGPGYALELWRLQDLSVREIEVVGSD